MKLNYNVAAMRANNMLKINDNNLTKSLNRLTSGYKITVSENPAAYSLAKRMNTHIEGTKIAKDTSGDAISIIHIADSALNEITDILQRLNELAVEASDETLTDDDKNCINDEAKELLNEIERMADVTQFNGQKLLNGSFDYKGYVTVDGKINSNFKMLYVSDEIPAGNYEFKDNTIYKDGEVFIHGTAQMNSDNILTIKDDTGKEFKFQTDGTMPEFKIEYPRIGAMTMQVGAMEGNKIDIRIPTISLSHMGLKNVDLVNNSKENLAKIKNALSYTSSVRSRLGAYENRFEHTRNNLEVTEESLTESYSRIMDTDIAEEMTNYSTQQILVQATMSMLAQANDRPAQILQLLN